MNPTCILVLIQGFVLVGEYERTATHVRLTNASVIRRWGTERGLGQLALSGPTVNTILDPCGTCEAPHHAVVMILSCSEEPWQGKL